MQYDFPECWQEPWDITRLPGPAKSIFFYLYLILDLYSRKIVGSEVDENESAEHASTLVCKAHLREGVGADVLVFQADNGSPMRGASLLETLHEPGVVTSHSHARVSNVNACAESLLRTCK